MEHLQVEGGNVLPREVIHRCIMPARVATQPAGFADRRGVGPSSGGYRAISAAQSSAALSMSARGIRDEMVKGSPERMCFRQGGENSRSRLVCSSISFVSDPVIVKARFGSVNSMLARPASSSPDGWAALRSNRAS